ncbi:esterase-like activity of phytase family protein [Streptomyces sp. NPDC053367]|uniref:esterase-like activity of phytase family protein n=1 Tax=Streptomyces sp. NPDC053367 TaxID=3365700 RepID=UPI0037D95355
MSPTATPPAAIFAFFDICVASFAATAALCGENGPVPGAVPDGDPDSTLRPVPYSSPRDRRAARPSSPRDRQAARPSSPRDRQAARPSSPRGRQAARPEAATTRSRACAAMFSPQGSNLAADSELVPRRPDVPLRRRPAPCSPFLRGGAASPAEYAYRFDPVGVVDPGEDDTSELKISSVVAVGRERLVVQERTDKAARLHLVRLSPAANILGGRWDDAAASPSLEQLEDPAAAGVPVLAKRLLVDLGTVPGVPGKIEGVARVADDTIAVVNDNDFGMTDGAGAFDAQGRLLDSGVETHVLYVRLPRGI